MPAFAAVPSSTHAFDSSDAILLNSGLFGAHARSSSFSTHLSGRFYKNSTLAAHAARKKRAARMRAKKRELEQAILLEERRAELLEERLRERKKECLRIQLRRQQAALEIQCWVRQRRAMQRVGHIRCHQRAMNQIVLFCQARYRGFRGREVARKRKREAAQKRKEHEASVRIQCVARARKAKKTVEIERAELRQRQYAGACTIQALIRGRQCRRRYNEMLQERQRRLHLQQQEACTRIQSIHRRNVARQEADRRRAEKQRAAEELTPTKPKRVPLHMRRYSTYSVAQVASIAVAATGTGTGSGAIKSRRSSVMGLTRPNLSKQQRRSSCPSVTLAAAIDANNSEAKSSETKSVESANASKVSVSESSPPSSTVAPPGADFARQARKRAAARVQERKLRSSDDDDRENKVAKTMRNRVAAFENKRKQRLATAKQKKFRKRCQVEQDSGGDGPVTATGAENIDNCCNDIVGGEERSPPQACHGGETSASPPPTPNKSATIPPVVASEASSEPDLADANTRNEPHNTTKEKPPIRVKKESPIHELAGFDAPFEDKFIETLDDLG